MVIKKVEWLRILIVLAFLWPVLVECRGNIRHYKFNVSSLFRVHVRKQNIISII